MIFRNKQKNQKWEKRPQLYKGKFYYLRKFVQFLMGASLVVGVASVVLYFRNSDTLLIQSVEILSQNTHIQPSEIIALSGITPKDKLFTVSLSQIAVNLRRHPWVESVQVRREFPNKIQIHVTERVPFLYVTAGETFIADQNGIVFKKKDPDENYTLPVITGLTKELAVDYPHIAKVYFNTVSNFYKNIQNDDFFKTHAIEQIHYDFSKGLTVFVDGHQLEIYFGKQDLPEKQARLNQLGRWETNLSGIFARLDLDLKDRIIARKRL